MRAPEREQRVHPAAAEPPRARGPHHQLGPRRDGAQGDRRVPGTVLYCTAMYCTVLYQDTDSDQLQLYKSASVEQYELVAVDKVSGITRASNNPSGPSQ